VACLRCNNTKQIKGSMGIIEVCASCIDKVESPSRLGVYPDDIIPASWQRQKRGQFNIEDLKLLLGMQDMSQLGLGKAEIAKYLGYVSRLLDASAGNASVDKIQSTLLSAPLCANQDDLVYGCLKLMLDQSGDIPLVPYITGYELYDLVMGKYLPYNIDSFYAEVNGISKKLNKVSGVADKLKGLHAQGLLSGVHSAKGKMSKVDVLLMDSQEGYLTENEIDIILGTFNDIKSNLKQLAHYEAVTNKRGYTLDDYINAPIVFISLGSTKPIFKYEIPALSLLLDIRGRSRLPTVVLTHSPALIYHKDPDGAGQFFRHYVYEKMDGMDSRLADLSSQSRLESVTCYRK
jgi:hypothetical protein